MTSSRTNFNSAAWREAPHRAPAARGVTAMLAMLFLILITTLTLAMFHVAASNVQTSDNFSDLTRAQQAAESGLRWTGYRFASIIRPRDMAGTITPAIAANIWARPDGLRDRLSASMKLVRDQSNKPIGVTAVGDTVQRRPGAHRLPAQDLHRLRPPARPRRRNRRPVPPRHQRRPLPQGIPLGLDGLQDRKEGQVRGRRQGADPARPQHDRRGPGRHGDGDQVPADPDAQRLHALRRGAEDQDSRLEHVPEGQSAS